MDIPAVSVEAPWGVNPETGKPWTKSPEERAAIGQRLAEARQAKAAAKQAEVAAAVPDPAEAVPIDRSTPDRAPGDRPPAGRRRSARRRAAGSTKTPVDAPPFKAGPIAKGMNRLYARAGKLARFVNPMIGQALIDMTHKDSDDDETVGEAWEALAQVSPVWRVRLLRLCSGGAAGRVLMAHLPLLMAVLMLEPVQKRMPFGHIVEAVFGGDEPATTGSDATVGAEPSFEDIAAMAAMAQQMSGPLMARMAQAGPRIPSPEDLNTVTAPPFDQAAAA